MKNSKRLETLAAKHNVKLTLKSLQNKIEMLQKEHKINVNKIRNLIPSMKVLMHAQDPKGSRSDEQNQPLFLQHSSFVCFVAAVL